MYHLWHVSCVVLNPYPINPGGRLSFGPYVKLMWQLVLFGCARSTNLWEIYIQGGPHKYYSRLMIGIDLVWPCGSKLDLTLMIRSNGFSRWGFNRTSMNIYLAKQSYYSVDQERTVEEETTSLGIY